MLPLHSMKCSVTVSVIIRIEAMLVWSCLRWSVERVCANCGSMAGDVIFSHHDDPGPIMIIFSVTAGVRVRVVMMMVLVK